MIWLVIVSLLVIGLVLILLEVLVVPGTTVVGFVGAGLMAVGVYLSFHEFGSQIGTITLLATVIFAVAAIAISIRTGTWKIMMLKTEIDGKVNIIETGKINPGDEGKTITRLNPVGNAIINEEFYEVVSKDNLIDENVEIVVLKVEGNKIIVKQKS